MHWGDYGWGMGFGSGGIFMILAIRDSRYFWYRLYC